MAGVVTTPHGDAATGSEGGSGHDGATGSDAGSRRDAARAGHVWHGQVPQRRLIGLLLRLKWTLWKRSYRGNLAQVVGVLFSALAGLAGLGGLAVAMGALVFVGGEGTVVPTMVRALGVWTTLIWLIAPLLAFGLDDTLDPRRFALFPRTAKELQPGLFAAAALSLPTLFTVLAVAIVTVLQATWLLFYGQGALWVALALIALVPANLAGVALCILLPRAIFAYSASRSSSRRTREVTGIIAMIAMIGGIYAFVLWMQTLADGITIDLEFWRPIVLTAIEVAAWTPLGALFAVPMDLAGGALLTALGRAVIGAATAVLLWFWWRRSISVTLTSALVGDASSGAAAIGKLVPRFAPTNALGAVIGKSLRYWRRDSRYLAAVSVMPLVLVFLVGLGVVGPTGAFMAIFGVLLVAGLSGSSLMNEIGFDGPSGWVNITTGLDSRANLLGRVIAMATFAVPFFLIAALVVPMLVDATELIPMVVTGTLGIMLSAFGVSVLIGVLLPYRASEPGTNPMKDKSANSASAMLTMSVGMIGVWIPQIPSIGIGIWGVLVGSALIQLVAGLLAIVLGALTLWLGVYVGAKILDRRYVALFQKVRNFV